MSRRGQNYGNTGLGGHRDGVPGRGDASSPRLTDAAERDYFILTERIETSGKMIAGLQEYIKQQCLN
ncbi:TPA: lysis protein [Klebsiella pneumoniae]|nr:lysis protein [Klebsiella pneumoniae]HCF8816650.1 lysis protein [Klebsiella pneumoniae]HCJ2396676.1 lysis protein [Klebsiella pneumoniae]